MDNRIGTDAVLHRALEQAHIEPEGEATPLEGRFFRAEKAHQQRAVVEHYGFDAPTHLAAKAAGFVAGHAIEHVEHAVVEVGLETAGLVKLAHGVKALTALPLLVGYEAAKASAEVLVHAFEDGDELGRAMRREHAVGACAMLLAPELPEAFRAELFAGFASPGVGSKGAVAVCDAVAGRPDAAAVLAAMARQCRDGQAVAIERAIRSKDDLEPQLRAHPDFAARYHGDLAFRLGVDVGIWAATHDAALVERVRASRVAPPAVEVRG